MHAKLFMNCSNLLSPHGLDKVCNSMLGCRKWASPSQPMKRASARSCERACPRKLPMGGGSGRAGMSALFPRQLCFWRMQSEKSSSSCDSWDTMQRYEHTWEHPHTLVNSPESALAGLLVVNGPQRYNSHMMVFSAGHITLERLETSFPSTPPTTIEVSTRDLIVHGAL